MTIRVRCFAFLKDDLGAEALDLVLPESSTIEAALAALVARHPSLARHVPSVAVALNREYTNRDQRLHEGDELALIPPVSGG